MRRKGGRNVRYVFVLALLSVALGAILNFFARPVQASPAADAPHGLGLIPSTAAEFERSPQFRITTASRNERPASVLLTDFLPPVGDQGAQGSCVGWATAYYSYTFGMAKQRKLTPPQVLETRFQFSPAYVYNQCNGGVNNGTSFGKAFALLSDKGCATRAEMAYNEKDFTTQPSNEAHERASRYKARNTGVIAQSKSDPEQIKTFLAEARQPVVIAIPVYRDFDSIHNAAPDRVYDLSVEPNETNRRGWHAITLIGYDDARRAFRLVNSWGTNWGDRGFLWIAEDFIRKHASESWASAPGGPVARDVRGPIQISRHITLELPR